jgi:hypothetical protein
MKKVLTNLSYHRLSTTDRNYFCHVFSSEDDHHGCSCRGQPCQHNYYNNEELQDDEDDGDYYRGTYIIIIIIIIISKFKLKIFEPIIITYNTTHWKIVTNIPTTEISINDYNNYEDGDDTTSSSYGRTFQGPWCGRM